MPSILDKIVAVKRGELAVAKRAAPLAAVQQAAGAQPRPLDLSGALGERRYPPHSRGQEGIAIARPAVSRL